MMLKKIKNLIQEFRTDLKILKSQNEIIKSQNDFLKNQLIEQEWADIYHDLVKGKKWLCQESLSIGRWAGNYSFFYLLVRILSDFKPTKIIEFGLGESSKVISSYLQNEIKCGTHLIIEENQVWLTEFKEKYQLSNFSKIIHLPQQTHLINNFDVNTYSNLISEVRDNFDFYLVDGPVGSAHFSRYDIVYLAEKIKSGDDFIILLDDYNRVGEKETVSILINQLESRGFEIFSGEYIGKRNQIIITTERYKFATSL